MAVLFDLKPRRSSREDANAVLAKMQEPKAAGVISLKGGQSLLARIKQIEQLVNLKLGKYASQYVILRTEEEVKEYVRACCAAEWTALDFETSGVNPMVDVIAGTVLYCDGQKPCYIPMNHASYITNARYENQCKDAFIREQLELLRQSKTKLEYDNAKFDIRMARNYLGIDMPVHWDTDVAAHMLNENEPFYALKALHIKYCDSQDDMAYSYSTLFDGVPFTMIPIKVGYLYAAGDGPKTDDLRKFQQSHLTKDKLPGVWNVYHNIELPLIPVTAAMEDRGVEIDMPYAQELSVKYHAILEECQKEFDEEVRRVQPQIDDWLKINRNTKEASHLRKTISASSPAQLAVLLYDVLRLPVVDKQKPRGTGEEILEQQDHAICKAIVKMRKVLKLLGTYIDKLPGEVVAKTGKIHASFHQNGTATGRYSSSSPNLQNIPSHNKDIRKMFIAGAEQVFISCDYSQQEPRVLAYVSGDEQFRTAYIEGRDLYSECASKIFNVPYEDCKEFRPDGTENPEGAKRRYFCKSVILGLMYGRGAAAIAEQCKIKVKEAQKIIDDFYNNFSQVREWMNQLLADGAQTGFVETIAGRKRRLPELQLADYDFRYTKDKKKEFFDPLDFGSLDDVVVDQHIIDKYLDHLAEARGFRQRNDVIRRARDAGIIITDNTGLKSRAQRQAVNAVIQGSSADMTKRAMITMEHDPLLMELKAYSVLSVHDELIMIAPRDTIAQSTKRIAEIMVQTAKDMVPIEIKWKCDTTVMDRWYGDPIEVEV